MTQYPTTPSATPINGPVPYAVQPNTSGVLSGRLFGYVVDLIVVGLLWTLFVAVLLVLGFVTFGLSWLLIAPLFPVIAVLYSGLTISGPRRGTIGMRLTGVEVQTTTGQTVPFIVAAVHAVFFYVSVSMLTPLVLLLGLVRADSRLLHDLLSGVIAVRRR